MSIEVRYTTRWNPATRRPALDHSWVPPAEAEALVRAGRGIEVVDASSRDADGEFRPLWVAGIGTAGAIRVQLFSPAGSVVRIADFELMVERLWHSSSTDYHYPDDSRRYRLAEADVTVRTTRVPDGTGRLAVRERASGQTHVTEFADVSTADGWLDPPEFGDWGPVVNATLGAFPGTPS